MNIQTIFLQRFPDAQYILVGNPQSENEYEENLTWFGEDAKPSWNELVSIWPDVEYQSDFDAVTVCRQLAYQQMSDPIFMQYQRGEATEKQWLAAVQAVKDANPYPVRAS